jgi:hypothetical protein
MKKFLSAILRNQFNLFYRFGYTFIPSSCLIEFDDIASQSTKNRIIDLFLHITPFQYDEEYIIIELEGNEVVFRETSKFLVRDIVAIYPLSKQAKFSIENKIDPRIYLQPPIFEDCLDVIQNRINNAEISNAISALWTLLEFDENVDQFIQTIGFENILKGLEYRKLGTKAGKIAAGNYWTYLIAYDRYDYFPNSNLGYFFDAGQVFAFSKGLDTFVGSGIHNFLQHLNEVSPNSKFEEVVKRMEAEENIKNGYLAQTSISGCKQYVIAPLFFKLKDDLRGNEEFENTLLFKKIKELKSRWGEHLKYAVVILGAFFGFEKFYDAYYDKLNLKFFKSYKKPVSQVYPLELKNSLLESMNDSKESLLESTVKEEVQLSGTNSIESTDDLIELSMVEVLSNETTDKNAPAPSVINEKNTELRTEIKSEAALFNVNLLTIVQRYINEGKGEASLSDITKDKDVKAILGKKAVSIDDIRKELVDCKELHFFSKGKKGLVRLSCSDLFD